MIATDVDAVNLMDFSDDAEDGLIATDIDADDLTDFSEITISDNDAYGLIATDTNADNLVDFPYDAAGGLIDAIYAGYLTD